VAGAAPPFKAPPVPPIPPNFGPPPTPPPVDETVLNMGQLFTVLAQDPKHRQKVLGLMREAAPGVPIPELDVARDVEEKITAATKSVADENKTLRERLDKLEIGDRQKKWQEANGVDDDELAAVTTLASEKKIHDPDTALDYYRKSELGKPRGTVASGMTDESRKLLYTKPKEWAFREGERVIKELRRRRGA
jgi:hypothetical protein